MAASGGIVERAPATSGFLSRLRPLAFAGAPSRANLRAPAAGIPVERPSAAVGITVERAPAAGAVGVPVRAARRAKLRRVGTASRQLRRAARPVRVGVRFRRASVRARGAEPDGGCAEAAPGTELLPPF